MTARWHILGPEIRAAREARGETLRACARRFGLAPSTLSLAERGGPVLGADTIGALAAHLRVGEATRERWLALAGHLPADLLAALLAAPDRWGDVRRLLLGCQRPATTLDLGAVVLCDVCSGARTVAAVSATATPDGTRVERNVRIPCSRCRGAGTRPARSPISSAP